MKYIGPAVISLSILSPLPASAVSVYAGCAIPTLKSGHHSFYVDPVNGSMAGDGSVAKPWRTLAEVVDPANGLISTQGHSWKYQYGTDTALYPVNPKGVVKPGDLILLMSGDHGAVQVLNMFNTDFITVAAAPGATPVLDKLAVVSSAKWMFQGLTFSGMATTATGATKTSPSSVGLVSTGRGDWEGATNNIVFDADTFETAASTNGWTNVDWINKPYGVGLWIAAPCTAAVSNHFTNVLNGITVGSSQALVQGNTIDHFSNDGMDVIASNVLIKNNSIKDGVNTTADPYHPDGIQGWSAAITGGVATNTNVVIDGNIVVKTGDPSVSWMQGISIFDGKWDGLVIQNNVVDVNTWNALTVYGVTNAKILNNTVIASNPNAAQSWIQVTKAKDGTPSANVIVRNNIGTQFGVDATNLTVDHNIAATKITLPVSGQATTITSGSVGTANSVNPAVLTGFATLNTSAGTFDMRLRSTSPAIGFGTLSGAPPLDILGKTRTSPVDVGAYNH
jgi:hypothetical protein